MFLVKREESRNFDVFFFFAFFFCVFGVWKREKMHREVGPRVKLSKIPLFEV